MPGLLGKKLGMTSVYDEQGQLVPVTVIEAGPCPVVAVRTDENDGYSAVQLGFEKKKVKNVNKPLAGHFKKAKVEPTYHLREFKTFESGEFNVGDEVKVDVFKAGDTVKVAGISKGKGFQGVMKRHGFSGVGGRTHGQKDRERAPGSIGQSSDPSRVLKGVKMPGRTGNARNTMLNLKVVKIDTDKNLLLIKGSIPGSINGIVEINK